MTGRVVVVSGAGSGLGLHLTRRLLDRGERVVANYATSAQALAELVEGMSPDRLRPVQGDLALESTSEELVAAAAQWGGPDTVIHNASITRDGLLVRMAAADWDAVQQVNLRGAFLLSKHALRRMMRHRTGRLIYVSSISARLGNAGQANYAASKAGLDGLARTIAQEYARHGITTAVLAAGLVATGMGQRLPAKIQQQKLGEVLHGAIDPDELSEITIRLSEPEMRMVNATTVDVNGGVVF